MRNRSIALASAVVLSLASGCATLDDGRASVLKPSMVSASFKDLDKDNPFAKPRTRVDLTTTGIATYDGFFRESAQVKGTVVLAEVVLGESDALADRLKKEVARGKALTVDQQRAVAAEKKRVDAITKLLTGLPDKSTKLGETSEALAKSAPKTFAGPKAVKLPGVMKGLEQSGKSLQDAAARSPQLLDRAAKSAAKLAELG